MARRAMRKMMGRFLLLLIASGTTMLLLVVPLLFLIPLPMEKTQLPEAYRYHDRNGELLHVLISKDGFFRMGIAAEDIPEHFHNALLMHEDRYFYQHFGVNPLAIVRATSSNIQSGKVVSGGSTITMQLARMLERRDRTVAAKVIEAFRAVQLELRYDKAEILSFYLSLAPYGGNLEGLASASYFYFGKPPSLLSIGESALLAGLPQAPNRYRPDRNPQAAGAMRDRILRRLEDEDHINKDQLRRALAEPVIAERRSPIGMIPHAAWSLRLEFPDRYQTNTTLDRNIQWQAQRLTSDYVKTLDFFGIGNAAVVVIDNETRAVRALIGSSDYHDKERLGANNGARLARSPGSTLKPFVYGLALQGGIISEKTMLDDIPVNFAGYSPRNFTESFRGPVSAREALTDSLNIPAVLLTQEVGLSSFHRLLSEGGISGLNADPNHYGLPLALGGVEVSLLELTNLYASLANNGIYEPWKLYNKVVAPGSRQQLLSPEATWIVTDMLTSVERPDFPSSWQFSQGRPTVAWKTGTSYGHQDAWSVGYTPRYTVGVWMGNFDRRPSSKLSGGEVAAPLLFNVMQILHRPHHSQWFERPEGVARRVVCATCGQVPTVNCTQFTKEYYIVDANGPATDAVCRVPQRIVVNIETGFPATDQTSPEMREEQIWNVWPSKMASFLARHGVGVEQAPPYDPRNMAGVAYYPPEILSPEPNTLYFRRPDRLSDDDHGIRLSAAVTNRIRTISWFLDNELIHQGSPWADLIIYPPPGDYRLRLVDDVGGEAETLLRIRDHRELTTNAH